MRQPDPKVINKKLNAMSNMFMFAYQLKKFQLKKQHPDWTEKQLNHGAYALIEKGCR